MRRKILLVLGLGCVVAALVSCAGWHKKKEQQRKSADALYQMGVQYLSEGNYQQGMVELRKAESMSPDNGRVLNALGLAYFYTEKYEEAEKNYRKAISMKKDYSEAYVNLGTLLARQGKYEDAIPYYRKALDDPFYPTPVLPLHNIGLCYQKMGDFQHAQESFTDALKQDPTNIPVYYDLGRLYYENNEMERAIGVLKQAIDRHPKAEDDRVNSMSLAYLHYWLALSYFKNGDSQSAAGHFREVTKLSSDSKLADEAWKYLELLQ